ncbi:DUF465 domain-containing protein [Flavobacterium psychrophilum]|uniref:Uncharacterized protein n=3 Tax=Flavobacterium psychrophilum TaxID=96345 RepID=A6GYS6_FLAPJ|nr:DUF465 domain-containing protein [Flavobacterium psychrophilum]ROO16446.1 GTP-binding protein [Flavobacterium psychrophilum 10]AIG29961.1 GTP-binding protein [Flavobacterium psychrophilum]AIG32238.1 GTP-binding protein [Flavobacterium psychrophilum]AIG34394.1 GTP-binding protein [Flavobacterium psychrophilum]AIG36757.1 GTP-binding protein [Flavobacterium psychrophilum]
MEKHNLLNEFPEYQEKIYHLKTENNHFKKLISEYDEIEHQIHRINIGEEVMIDEAFKELKLKMIHIKDEIFNMLKA